MSKQQNITKLFLETGISEEEILECLLQGDARAENGVYYFQGDQIKVEFSQKDSSIKNIFGDPSSFFVSRILKVLNEIKSDNTTDLAHLVVMGRKPLNGTYTYKDKLLIRPLFSKPNYIGTRIPNFNYPFIIEFKYNSCYTPDSTSPAWSVKLLRRSTSREEILLILNLLIYGGIRDVYDSAGNWIWTQVPEKWREPREDEINSPIDHLVPDEDSNSKFMYLRSFYQLDDIDVNTSDKFSNVSVFPSIERQPIGAYYNHNGVLFRDSIALPDTIDELLGKFFSLKCKTEFKRALYWFKKSNETRKISASISYNCLIQAIEVLADNESPTESCDKHGCENKVFKSRKCLDCDKNISEFGPTQAFKDFIEKYAGDTPNKLKNQLYSLRSAITHGSLLMEMDGQTNGFNHRYQNQRDLYDTASSLVQISLINWLTSR